MTTHRYLFDEQHAPSVGQVVHWWRDLCIGHIADIRGSIITIRWDIKPPPVGPHWWHEWDKHFRFHQREGHLALDKHSEIG